VSVFVIVGALVVVGGQLYANPRIDPLRRADVILVLGGFGEDRYMMGLRMGFEGWAPVTVISIAAWNDVWRKYCSDPHPELRMRLQCFVPDPPTTKGEVREFARLAKEYNWRSVVVLTYRPHISRARYILRQCFDGEITMVQSPAEISQAEWACQYLYQTAGYVKAMLEPAC
jgi:hypothetical protein